MNPSKTFGGVLVGIGLVLIGIGVVWGRTGYYVDQAPILIALVAGGAVLALIGGVVARGSGAPEVPGGAQMRSAPDRADPTVGATDSPLTQPIVIDVLPPRVEIVQSTVVAEPTTISSAREDTSRERATNPSTSGEELAALALDHPELAALVYGHPNAYDDLRNWISTYRSEELAAAEAPHTASPSEPETATPAVIPTIVAPLESVPNPSESATPATSLVLPNTWLGEWPRRTVIVAGAIVAAGLLGGGGIIAGFAATARQLDGEAQTIAQAEPEPGIDFSPVTQPTAEPTVTAAPVGGRIPETCDDLYSPQYAGAIEAAGYRNDTASRVTTPAGTADQRLAALLGGERLECAWHQNDTDRTGIETSVIEVDQATAAAATQRFQELGFATLNELGGTRWFIESVQADGVHTGESHIIRDGIWFATRWVIYGPDGYTADMIHRMFG